jgi:hypothetical protein
MWLMIETNALIALTYIAGPCWRSASSRWGSDYCGRIADLTRECLDGLMHAGPAT